MASWTCKPLPRPHAPAACDGRRCRAPGKTTPKGPCNYMVDTWALKGVLNLSFGVLVGTIVILGPFGDAGGHAPETLPRLAKGVALS